MSQARLQEIEMSIGELTENEKQSLMDRLANDLQAGQPNDMTKELAAMAADPDIQRELRAIEMEFADTAEDGLEKL